MGWLLLVVIGVGGGLVMGATLALVALEILRSTRPPGESSPARHEAAPGRALPRSREAPGLAPR